MREETEITSDSTMASKSVTKAKSGRLIRSAKSQGNYSKNAPSKSAPSKSATSAKASKFSPFSPHSSDSASSTNSAVLQSELICRRFFFGKCNAGKRCKYLHEIPSSLRKLGRAASPEDQSVSILSENLSNLSETEDVTEKPPDMSTYETIAKSSDVESSRLARTQCEYEVTNPQSVYVADELRLRRVRGQKKILKASSPSHSEVPAPEQKE